MYEITTDELIATEKVMHHNAKGYVEFCELMNQLQESGQPIYVLFSGSKDETGKSWCPSCVTAERVIEKALAKVNESHFVHVDVGDLAYWRDVDCPFRIDPKINLVYLPTFMKWNTLSRVDGLSCLKLELVEAIFKI